MDRRSIIAAAGGVIVGGAAVAVIGGGGSSSSDQGAPAAPAAPSINTGKRELKMVMTWPRDFPGLGTGAQRVASRINAMSDNRINVTLYAAGELVPAFESFDAVSSGTADMFHAASYYWQGKNPAFNFFTAVPFGLTANELQAWVNWGGGQELWDELAEGFNLKPMLAGNTGVQMGGWFSKEINTPDDLVGLKMRMPGLGGKVLNKLGASAIALPGGEIFQALQSGTVDATEWVGPWNDLAMGFYKVTSYYYYPGFHEPGSGLECTFNLDVWNSFSKSDQELLKAACHAENDIMLSEYNAKNTDSLDKLLNEEGVQLR
ncbi:MAG: TRAP transporter substrate-binding protein, partial [Alphaproteobacteria bacterium]|nr:TRAP transporter substrate-binding protein [Alphaproteobacteria bacterium]